MKGKQIAGSVAALVGLGLGVWWWLKRKQPAEKAPGVAVADATGGIGTIGNTTVQELTPELVQSILDETFDFVTKQNCWTPNGAKDGKYFYVQRGTGATVSVPVERVAFDAPLNLCGREAVNPGAATAAQRAGLGQSGGSFEGMFDYNGFDLSKGADGSVSYKPRNGQPGGRVDAVHVTFFGPAGRCRDSYDKDGQVIQSTC